MSMSATVSASAHTQAALGVSIDFLSAKVRARRSLLYEGDRLRELVEERELSELAWRLFPRQEIPDHLALERKLTAACAADLWSITALTGGRYRALCRAMLERYPIENLKVLLRLLGRPDAPQAAEQHLIELPGPLQLPVERLLSSPDEEAFVHQMPPGAAQSAAMKAIGLVRETGHRAFLEMAFDQGYWSAIWACLEALPADEFAQSAGPLRCEFDALRLLGTMRAAAVYGLPWEQWEALLPPGRGAISVATLRRVHANPDPEAISRAVPWVDRVLERFPPGERGDLYALEDSFWQETMRVANRQYYAVPVGLAVIAAYFYLKRNELRNLLGLTQMLRRGWDRDRVTQALGL